MNKKLNNRYTTKKRKSSNKKRTLRNKTKLGKQQRKRRVVQIGGISEKEIVHLIKTTLDDTELLDSDGTVNESKQTQKVREIIDIIKRPPDQSKSTEPSTLSKSAESVLREPLLNSHNGSEATPQIHTEDQKKLNPAKQTVLYAACNLKIPSLGIVRELLNLDEIKINPNSFNPGAWPQHGAVLAAIDILNDDRISDENKYRRLLVILNILKMLKSKSEGGIFQQKKYNRGDYGGRSLMAQRYDLSRHNSDYEPSGATALDEFDEKLKPLISVKLSRFSEAVVSIIQEFTAVLDYSPRYTRPHPG